MTKKDLLVRFEEKFPDACGSLLHYMFDYFDAHHLKGLLDHINDVNNEEDIEDILLGEFEDDDEDDEPGDIGWNGGEFYK